MTLKPFFLLPLVLAASVAGVWGHEIPIPENHMELIADPGHLLVLFHSGAPWWVDELLDERTPPPTHWPEPVKNAVKSYYDRHFIVKADGKVLPSTLVRERYSEEIWRYILGSRLDLELTYTLPTGAQVLSGEATFYKEAWDAMARESVPKGVQPRFETHIHTSGPVPRTFTLTLSHPEFSLLVSDLLRTPVQRWHENWRDGLAVWSHAPWLLLAFIALALQARARAGLAVRFTFVSVAGTAGAIAAAQHAGRLNCGYTIGILTTLASVVPLLESTLWLYRRRLTQVSESQADALFTSQIRFFSLLAGVIALYLAAEMLWKPS